MEPVHIDIGKDFSPTPGTRYRADGPWSGEQFREEVLEPAFERASQVIVHLDSIKGYSASFFEEAFGGIVRKYGYAAVRKKIAFVAIRRRYLIPRVLSWMEEAAGEEPEPARRARR